MKKALLLFFVIIAGAAAALCFPWINRMIFGGSSLTIPEFPPPRLARSYIPPSDVPASRIAVPVTLFMEDLQSLADRNLPRRYDDAVEYLEGTVEGKLNYMVRREEDAEVSAENGKIKIFIPLQFQVRFAGSVLAAIVRVPFSSQTDGALNVFITVSPSLRRDWSIKTDIEVDFAWVKPPKLNVLGIPIGLQRVSDKFLRDAIRDNLYKVDDIINEEVGLRDIMQREWDNLAVPIQAADSVFLHFDPRSIAASPLDITSDNITLRARVEAGISLSVGLGDADEGTRVNRKKNLPPLGQLEKNIPDDPDALTEDLIELEVRALMNYDAMENEAMKALSGAAIDLGAASVAVKSLRLTGSGENLVAAFEISAGSSNGTIYAIGAPYFNEEERVLSIRDFDLDEGTRAGLIGTAAWLLRPALVNFLREKLEWELGAKIDELADEARNVIASRALSNEIELQGTLQSAEFKNLRVTGEGIEIGLSLEGTAALTYRPNY